MADFFHIQIYFVVSSTCYVPCVLCAQLFSCVRNLLHKSKMCQQLMQLIVLEKKWQIATQTTPSFPDSASSYPYKPNRNNNLGPTPVHYSYTILLKFIISKEVILIAT